MTFKEFYQSRGQRIYINWYNQSKSHNKLSSIVSIDLDISMRDTYVLENEYSTWHFYKYLIISYDKDNLLSRYGVNPNDAEMYPYVIVSDDNTTWTLTGFDETFSINSIKFIGRLNGFRSDRGTSEIDIRYQLELVAQEFDYATASDYVESIIRSTFECVFYQLECEKHLVDKSNNLSLYYVGGGQLTEECDLLNPSILISTDFDIPDSVFSANYVYIEKFNRYYFINKITCIRNDLWRLDLHVDVLYSYNTDIRKQSGSIIRSGNWHHAIGLVDDRLPLRDVPQLMVYNVPFKANSDNPLIYVQFLPENQLNDNIVISVINNQSPEDDTTKNQTTTFDILPNVQRKNFKNTLINSYVISSSQLETILNIIKADDNKASFIANIIAFPFTLPSKDISYTQTQINLGSESTGVSGVLLNSNISTYLYLTDFTCDSNYFPLFTERYDNELSFLNYEPYCQCEIYLPYYGWTKLSIKDIYNQKISVYYVVDYLSGSATVNVYNNFRHTIIFSAQCQLGIEISKSTTNQREISDRKNAIGINTALSLVASAISVGVGFASSNPLAVVGGVAGGVMAGAKAIASAVNENNMLYDTAQAQFSDGNTGLLAPQRCRLKFQYRFIDAYDNSVYRHLNGYPCNRYKPLTAQSSGEDTYTGYTEVIFHYTPDTQTWITTTEISEIEELAKNGIIL